MIGLCTLDLNVNQHEERVELAVWVHLSLQHNTVVLCPVPRVTSPLKLVAEVPLTSGGSGFSPRNSSQRTNF